MVVCNHKKNYVYYHLFLNFQDDFVLNIHAKNGKKSYRCHGLYDNMVYLILHPYIFLLFHTEKSL